MADKPVQEVAASAPDPEEDDLDDLDDVLDSFQESKISEQKPAPAPAPASLSTATTTAPAASGPGRPKISQDAGSEEEDFAAQLQAGVSNLISELDANPEMQTEFEKLMQELVSAGAASTDAKAGEHLRKVAEAVSLPPQQERKPKESEKKDKGGGGGGGGGGKAGFDEQVRKTMERMQASDSTARQSTCSANHMSEEDLLAQMMREITEGGAGDGGDEGFNAMLMDIMAHLTNKEILYEPMKELDEKFPGWMARNEAQTGKSEMERYREQRRLVREVVERFERREYSDENEQDREYIVERMQKMQAAGSPPSDLVGDISAAQEAIGDLESGCPTQ